MSVNYETGHAKNVANFNELISFCKSYGAAYNPGKKALSVTSLESILQESKEALEQVKNTQTTFSNATNSRRDLFTPLKSLATKIVNALDATDATVETVKDAKAINKKLQGQRASTKKATVSPGTTNPADVKTISASQQSFDQQIEHFARLITLVASDTNYAPNETDLQVAVNQQKLAELKNANSLVVDAYTAWSNSRIERNRILYTALSGLVAIASDVKKYIKSLYGAASPQYKQVAGLEFKTRNG